MAFVRKTLAEAAAMGCCDPATLNATTEDDIRRHMIKDGEDPDAPLPAVFRVVESPASLRARLGFTQPEMAARLRVPLEMWQDLESGRVGLDPSVRALLDAMAATTE